MTRQETVFVATAEYRDTVDTCLFCGSRDLGECVNGVQDWFFGNVDGQFTLSRCKSCQSLVLRDPLTAAYLPRAYASYYTHAATPTYAAGKLKETLRQRYIARRFGASGALLDRLGGALFRFMASDLSRIEARYRFAPPAPARILDYGCGAGSYLKTMRTLGYEVVGVDFDPVCVGLVEEEGIPAYAPDDLPSEEFSEQFDFITLNHVIEHVPDPDELVARLAGWLRPGGCLYVETPNANAEGLHIFQEYWRGLEAPRHLALASSDGLERLFAASGLSVVRRYLAPNTRANVWQESLSQVPQDNRTGVEARMAGAQPDNLANGEFITMIGKKT